MTGDTRGDRGYRKRQGIQGVTEGIGAYRGLQGIQEVIGDTVDDRGSRG